MSYRADAPAAYAQAIEPVLAVLAALSPVVEWSADPADASAATRHEPSARYAVFLDGTGLVALYGSEARLARLIVRELWEQAGHAAQVGIADGRYAALLAALWGGEVVPPGGDAAFLAPLPVSVLPLPREARERLTALGARTLADVGRLPGNALRHRFGPDGVVARALAAGHDEGPLRPRPMPLQLHDALDLEWVETSLDRLLFLLKRLADRLSVRLAQHGLGCGRLRIVWLLDAAGLTTGDDLSGIDGDDGAAEGDHRRAADADGLSDEGTVVSIVRLAEPGASGSTLLEHLRWHVEGLRPERFRDPHTGRQRGVRGLLVEAEELGPLGGRQLALLPGEDGRTPEPERLLSAARTLARLQTRWGETCVQQAELVASRRPEQAFRWRELTSTALLAAPPASPTRRGGRKLAGRQTKALTLRPSRATGPGGEVWLLSLAAVPEEVQIDRGGRQPNGRRRPGSVTQGKRVRRIVQAAGPWRLVERWVAEPVARDAYHVVLADGTACWLVHDRLTDRWLLLGTFD
ncbi:MAG: hypothetical protein IT306_03050 [Chloroflexi bacterium]|nr:hypothetical protein [Chloroflexota bacterium]